MLHRSSMYIFEKKVMEKFSKELIGASSIPMILSILSQGESYGYEIIKRIKELSGDKIEFKEGTMYPVLHKLEKKGLIESFWKQSETGRKRKYYKITTRGRQELDLEKENWCTINTIIASLWKIEPKLA